MCSTDDIIHYAQNVLSTARPASETAMPGAREAAVCLLLYDCNGPMIMAIQKADTDGYPWRNQVALPGGHISGNDASPTDAALRELEEELGVPDSAVEVLGTIGRFGAIHASVNITAVAAFWKRPGQLFPDTQEIARFFPIPLRLLWATHHNEGFRGKSIRELGKSLVYPVCPVCDVPVWGLTARVIHGFLEILAPRLEVCPNLTQFT